MPSQNFQGQFLDTIGIEFESVGLNQSVANRILGDLRRITGKNLYSVSRDASTESFYVNYRSRNIRGTFPLYLHTEMARSLAGINNFERLAGGYEIISIPMEIRDFEESIFHITRLLNNSGDFLSNRAATHFHIGFANNLRILKKLLRICLWIEPLLFRLGGMGGKQRGFVNQSAYARPLLAPPVVKVGNLYRPETPQDIEMFGNIKYPKVPPEFAYTLNARKALEAETFDEFWRAFSVFPRHTGTPKYHPSRYVGCNFYALLQHGTMEFRHFNQTLDPLLISSVGKFLRAVVELSTLISKQDLTTFSERNSLEQLSDSDVEDSYYILNALFRQYEIENIPTTSEMEYLRDITLKSSFSPIKEKFVLSHVKTAKLYTNFALLAGLEIIQEKEVMLPEYVDSHNIRISRIIQEGE